MEWLNGRASVIGTEGFGFEPGPEDFYHRTLPAKRDYCCVCVKMHRYAEHEGINMTQYLTSNILVSTIKT